MFIVHVNDKSTLKDESETNEYEIHGLEAVGIGSYIRTRSKDHYRYAEYGLQIRAPEIYHTVKYTDLEGKDKVYKNKCYQANIPFHHCTVRIETEFEESEVWELSYDKIQLLYQKLKLIEGLESV